MTVETKPRPPNHDPRLIVLKGEFADPVAPPPTDRTWPIVSAAYLGNQLANCQHAEPMLFVDTPGGSHAASVQMFHTLRGEQRIITTIAARCLSAGVMVFAAGDRRLMHPNGCLVFHSPVIMAAMFADESMPVPAWVQEMLDGTIAHFREESIRLLCERWPQVSPETMGEWLDTHREFNAVEAVQAGLADGILGTATAYLGTTYANKTSCGEFPFFPMPAGGNGACVCAEGGGGECCENFASIFATLSSTCGKISGTVELFNIGIQQWQGFLGALDPCDAAGGFYVTVSCDAGNWTIDILGNNCSGGTSTTTDKACDPLDVTFEDFTMGCVETDCGGTPTTDECGGATVSVTLTE